MRLSETDVLAFQAKGIKINDQYSSRSNNQANHLSHQVDYSNRGMNLQHLVERANDEYLALNIAHIHSPGTPARNILDPDTGGRKLVYAPSTVDHLGSWQGYSIAFDDKATQKDELPAVSVKEHQIEFLLNHQKIGRGLSFLLVGYTEWGRFFVVMINDYFKIWAGRMGLKIELAEKVGAEVWAGRTCLDYLQGVEALFVRKA